MKRFFLVALLSLLSTISIAQEGGSKVRAAGPNSTSELSLDDESSLLEEDTPTWNLNLGLSSMTGYSVENKNLGGNGLSVELLRKMTERSFLGASYTNYSIDSSSVAPTRIHAATASAEFRPVDVEMARNTSFFAALNGGAVFMDSESIGSDEIENSFFYGGGIGVNYSDKVGVRADIKSSRLFSNSASLMITGYY